MKEEFTTVRMGSLTRPYRGFYTELLIYNCTHEPVVIVDSSNARIPLPPVGGMNTDPAVKIMWRRSVNPTQSVEGVPQAIDGLQLVIHEQRLRTEGAIYVDKLGLLVCSEIAAADARHPNSVVGRQQAEQELRQQIIDTVDEAPTFKIFINDPKRRFNHLYTNLCGMVLEIPVTDLAATAELKLVCSCNGQYNEQYIDLEEFLSSSESILELVDSPVTFLTINRTLAERAASDYQRFSRKQFDDILKREQEKYAAEKKRISEAHKAEIEVLNSKLDVATQKLQQMTTDYNRIKAEYDSFVGSTNAESKIDENQVRRYKIASDNSTERWKTAGVYGGLALGAITLLLKAIELGRKTSSS